MGWRGSETGRDSKTLRKRKVEKGRNGEGLTSRGEKREQQRMDTKATVKEEQASLSPSVGWDRREGVTSLRVGMSCSPSPDPTTPP